MKKLLAVCGLIALTGCSWATSHEGQLAQDGMKLALCVTSQLLAGVTDPAKIAQHCLVPMTPEFLNLVATQADQVKMAREQGKAGVCK